MLLAMVAVRNGRPSVITASFANSSREIGSLPSVSGTETRSAVSMTFSSVAMRLSASVPSNST